MDFQMLGITILSNSGDPAYEDAFNYFFSLMVNMGFVFIVPYIVLKFVGDWGSKEKY